MKRNVIWILVVGLSFVLFATGCRGQRFKTVPHGVVSGTGIRIEAADKRFVLESGKPFTPPIEVKPPREIEFADAEITAYGNKVAPHHRVVVYVPGREVPLFGKLMFLKVFRDFDGPASRSYQVQIPQNYIDAATGGRLSVVYETYASDETRWVDGINVPAKRVAWALWLSDRPF